MMESWMGPSWEIKNIRLERVGEDRYEMKADVIAASEEEAVEVRAYFEAVVQGVVSTFRRDFMAHIGKTAKRVPGTWRVVYE